MPNCDDTVSDFELELRYYLYFWINTLGKEYEPPYPDKLALNNLRRLNKCTKQNQLEIREIFIPTLNTLHGTLLRAGEFPGFPLTTTIMCRAFFFKLRFRVTDFNFYFYYMSRLSKNISYQ